MRVSGNLLLQPQDTLRIEEIEEQLKWCERVAGAAAGFVMPWAICFALLVWAVIDYGYSWSPLSWLGPLGVVIASSSVASSCHKRKLHAEKKRLHQRAGQFVIHDDILNRFKSDLQILTNSALHSCVIPEQREEVLSAYCAAAQKLMYLDGSDPTTTAQSEVIENFLELRNTLRIIGDEMAGGRERSLP